MDPSNLAGALFAAGAVIIVLYFLIIILMIISQWMIFEKAKQPGWAVLIPVYNYIVLLRCASLHWAFVFILVALFIPFLNFIAFFGIIAMNIIIAIRLAKNFGQSGGFAAGLILLPVVFYPIMAFKKDIQWTGELDKNAQAPGTEYKEIED